MEYLVAFSGAVLVYCLFELALRGKTARAEAVRRRLETIAGASNKETARGEELSRPFSERIFRPAVKSAADFLARLLPGRLQAGEAGAAAGPKRLTGLKKRLVQAGSSLSVSEYGALRLVVLFVSGGAFALPAVCLRLRAFSVLLFALAGIFAGYALTRFFLAAAIVRRQRAIERQLPDALDLLSISVEAGLGFEQALGHVVASMSGPLIDEFTVTSREMSMGRSRRDALTQLGERCDIEEVRSLTGALVQAGQLGIPLRNLLRAQSEALRQQRRAKIQEKSMKISVEILFPMLIFIFPVLFIVILGPAIVNVMKVLHL